MKPILPFLVIASIPALLASTLNPEELSSKWLNRTASELVEAYGQPDMILETGVNGVVNEGAYCIMYVYTSDPENRRGCFAAYVVEHDSGLILRYKCRYVNRVMGDGVGTR